MPFDALDGFYKTIREKETIYDTQVFLAEDEQERLNEIFCTLQAGDTIKIKYYSNKRYVYRSGIIHSIDNLKKRIIFTDETIIKFKDILDIKCI